MKSRNVILTLIFILLLSGIFLCRKWREPVRSEAFDRSPARLVYAQQAVCLMDCQQVSKQEIEQVKRKGVILLNKSDRFHRPCPTFALQGTTSRGKSLRVIFEQCVTETKVVYCTIVKQELKCACPDDMNNVN